MTTIAMLGVGNMGAALGASILQAGHDLVVWNRSRERADALEPLGATVAERPVDAIEACDLLVICLLDQRTTFEVLDADDAAIGSLAGKVVVQLSMRSASEALDFQSWVTGRGAEYLDGFIKAYPRDIGAETSFIHYSGSRHAFDTWRPALEAMGPARFISEDVEQGVRLNCVGVALLEAIVGAYFQSAALAEALGVPDEHILTVLDRALALANTTVQLARRRERLGDEAPASEASLAVHRNALDSNLETLGALGLNHEYATLAAAHLRLAEESGLGPFEEHVLWDYYGRGLSRP